MWAADTIAPASILYMYIALRYNKPNKPENHKVSYLLHFFNNFLIPRISIFWNIYNEFQIA